MRHCLLPFFLYSSVQVPNKSRHENYELLVPAVCIKLLCNNNEMITFASAVKIELRSGMDIPLFW